MADLVERLMGSNTDGRQKLPVHAFIAALAEYARGKITAQQIIDFFVLNAAEQTEAANLYNAILTGNASISTGNQAADIVRRAQVVENVLNMAERLSATNPYPTAASVRTRFGI